MNPCQTRGASPYNSTMRAALITIVVLVIFFYNIRLADYKLLVAQVGTVALLGYCLLLSLRRRPIHRMVAPAPEAISNKGLLRSPRAIAKGSLAMTTVNWPLLFLAVLFLSFLTSPNKAISGHEFYKQATFIIFGLLVARHFDFKTVGTFLNAWLIGAFMVALYGIAQGMGFDFRKWELGTNAGRVFGTFGNPTLLAGFLAASIPIGIGKIVAQISTDGKAQMSTDEFTDGHRYLRSSVYLFVTAIMLLALFLTFSRGAYIAASVSIFVMVVLYKIQLRRHRLAQIKNSQMGTDRRGTDKSNGPALGGSCRNRRREVPLLPIPLRQLTSSFLTSLFWKESETSQHQYKETSHICQGRNLVLIILLLAGAVLVFFHPNVKITIQDILFRKTARPYIWLGAARMFLAHPVKGYGLGTFTLNFPEFRPPALDRFHTWEYVRHAHNEFLEIAAEMGILGLLAFLAVIAAVIRAFFSHCEEPSGCEASAISKAEIASLASRRSRGPSARNDGYLTAAPRTLHLALFGSFTAMLVNGLFNFDLRLASGGMFFWPVAVLFLEGPKGTVPLNFKGTVPFSVTSPPVIARSEARFAREARRATKQSLLLRLPRNFQFLLPPLVIIGCVFLIYIAASPFLVDNAFARDNFSSPPQSDTELAHTISQLEPLALRGGLSANRYMRLGTCYGKKGDWEKAQGYLERARALDPTLSGVYNNLGNVILMRAGKNDKRAEDFYKEEIAKNPGLIDSYINLAYLYIQRAAMKDALHYVESALRIDPHNAKALLLRRQVLSE